MAKKNSKWEPKSTILAIIFYLLISFFFLRGVLLSSGIIQGGDWGLPFTLRQVNRYINSGFYTWTNTSLFGIQQFFLNGLPFQILTGLVAKIGIVGEIYTKLLLILAFVFPALSMYLFCKFLNCSNKIAFWGGFLYITTPFFFNYAAMGWLFVLLSMGILPLALILFIKSVKEKKVTHSILTGILYFLAMINSQSLVWFPLVFFCFSIFLIKDRKSFFSYIKSLLVVFLVFLGLNTYMWIPLFWGGGSKIVSTKLGSSSVSLGIWAKLSYSNISRLWGSLFNYQYETSYPEILTPLSFLLPLLAFSSLIFIKKKKILLSFAVLAFVTVVLFTLGPEIIVRIPFSDIFRDIARSLILPSFSYVIMATLFLDFLFKQKKKYFNLVGVVLIILFIVNAYPFWAGELFGEQKQQHDIRLRTYNFPKGYFDLENYLINQPADIKILYLPIGGSLNLLDDKRFYGPFKEIRDIFADYSPKPGAVGISDKGLGSATDFSLILTNKTKQNQFASPDKLLSLMAVKYIAVRENAISPLWEKTNFLEKQPEIIVEEKWDKVSLLKNNYFLPHFYIPENIIYSPNEVEILPDILSMDDYEIRSAVYIADNADIKNADNADEENADNADKKNTDNALNADNADIKGADNADIIVVKGENRKDIEKILNQVQDDGGGGIVYPHIKHEPGSWQWKGALLKEKYDKWQARKEPEKLLEKHLFYANKRINELKEFYADNALNADNADRNTDKADRGADNADEKTRITELYREEMTAALDILENLKLEGNEEFIKLLAKYNGTLAGHQEKLEELGFLAKENDLEKVFEELERRAEELKIKQDFSKLVYEVDIPKNGNYKMYIKEINGLTDYSLLEERYFEKGKQELVLPIKGISENLLDKNLKIKGYLSNSFYKISLDYQTPTPVSLSLEESDGKEISKVNLPPTDDKFESLEFFLKSSPEASSAALKLIGFEEEKPETKYRNLQVQQILQPDLILRSKNADIKNADNAGEDTDNADISADKADEETRIPKITFVKVNPTKYRVKVEGAKEPYTLVFSESFHEGWKLYLKEKEEKLGNSLAPLAEIEKLEIDGEGIANNAGENTDKADRKNTDNADEENVDKADKRYGEEVASYFDGQIKEGTHRNTFLEKATFETWGKKPIAEERHYLVNGYANSWYINPDDVGGAENYELIVEFWPQRLFYIGLFISGLTLVGCLGYLGYETIKKRN